MRTRRITIDRPIPSLALAQACRDAYEAFEGREGVSVRVRKRGDAWHLTTDGPIDAIGVFVAGYLAREAAPEPRFTAAQAEDLRARIAAFYEAEAEANDDGWGMSDTDPLADAFYQAGDLITALEKILSPEVSPEVSPEAPKDASALASAWAPE